MTIQKTEPQPQQPGQKGPLEQAIITMAVSPDVAHDGTILAVTSDGTLFSSTDRGGTWRTVSLPGSGMAMSVALSATFDKDGLMWVSLPEGQLVSSADRGQTWIDSYITRPASAASALAASPEVGKDGLVLAATLEDGVLRSLDRGRTWSPGNFGLLDLKTLGLVVCPSFAAEQIVLVMTESALYRSRNGGLSWKEAGFWEDALQCAVFSPAFAEDRRAWAGTEKNGLMQSQDGGVTWQPVSTFPKAAGEGAAVSINSLATLSLEKTWILAGTSAGLYASSDLGTTWKLALPDVNILTLATGGKGAASWTFAASETDGLFACNGRPDTWKKL